MDNRNINETLNSIAVLFARLSSDPRFPIEHSAVAGARLREALSELRLIHDRASSELASAAGTAVIAQFGDVIAVLDRLVYQIDRRTPPSSVNHEVFRLGQELEFIAVRIQELSGRQPALVGLPSTDPVGRPESERVISFRERKGPILSDQIAKLTQEYEACAEALGMTIGPSEELRLQRKMESIENQIKTMEQELAKLDPPPTSQSPSPDSLLPTMTPMNKSDEIRAAKLRRLEALRLQQAQFGTFTPAYITTEIEDLEVEFGLRPPRTPTASQTEPPAPDGSGAG